jgi:hypothetical protein
MHWMDVGRTSSNCNKEGSLLLQGKLLTLLDPGYYEPVHLSLDNKVVISLNVQFYSKTVMFLLVSLYLTTHACTQLCT